METSKTVDRALHVLTAVGARGPVAVPDLATQLDLNRTVVYRLLSTLQKHGFVRQTGRGYVAGPAVIELARRIEPLLIACSRAPMEDLSQETGETVVLALAQGTEAVSIDQVVGTRYPLRVEYSIGARSPLTQGASGRVLLSMTDPEIRDLIMERAPDPRALERELDKIVDAGFAESADELQPGIHGIAVPVTDGYLVATLSLLSPTNRAKESSGHLELLLRARDRIQENMKDSDAS